MKRKSRTSLFTARSAHTRADGLPSCLSIERRPASLSTPVLREHLSKGRTQILVGLAHRLALPLALELLTPMPRDPLPTPPFCPGVYETICGVVDDRQRLLTDSDQTILRYNPCHARSKVIATSRRRQGPHFNRCRCNPIESTVGRHPRASFSRLSSEACLLMTW